MLFSNGKNVIFPGSQHNKNEIKMKCFSQQKNEIAFGVVQR
jgi:hypothetical protein